jgi:hypothetical protein
MPGIFHETAAGIFNYPVVFLGNLNPVRISYLPCARGSIGDLAIGEQGQAILDAAEEIALAAEFQAGNSLEGRYSVNPALQNYQKKDGTHQT